MACIKCGSSWVTATGQNCAACPHCCKQAKCRERKAGRWVDEIDSRNCVWCEQPFTPDSIHKRHANTCSESCRKQHRKRLKLLRKSAGVKQKQLHGQKKPPCKRCGKDVNRHRDQYCCRACYQADKKDGIIKWDLTGQLLGDIRKRRAQGLPMPSQVMYAAIQEAMRNQFATAGVMWKTLSNWRLCLNCCGPLKDHATENTLFCSIPCAAEYAHEVHCGDCGKPFIKKGMQGRRRPRCRTCKRRQVNKQRRAYGKSIKERAIKFNVERVPYSRLEVFDRDDWRCQLCGCGLLRKWTYNKTSLAPHPKNATIDHIVPMSKGGADAEWNVQACCLECNSTKSSTTKGQLRLRLR